MKIAIDISQIVYGTGVSVYTKELVRALLRVAPEHEYILYAGVLRRKKDVENYIKTLEGSFRFISLPLPPQVSHLLWNVVRPFPIEVFLGNFDVLHTSDWTEPFSKYPKVTTIHDLSPLLYPDVTPPKIRQVFEKKLHLVKKDRDLVITPSVSIAEEVLSQGIDSSLVHTISEAPNPDLINAPTIDIRKRFGIEGKFILMVGTAERKNLIRSADAVFALKQKDVQLVIVGEKQIDLPTATHIVYTGYVTTHELANLYRESEVFLYPSLYEGFGIPILEAFSLDTAVVTSNIGSMQELGAEAAVLVNPYDTEDIKAGIQKALLHRNTLKNKGKVFVKGFSWDKTALETVKIYKKAYERK